MKKLLLLSTGLILITISAQSVWAQFEVGKQFFSPTWDNQTVVLTQDYTTTEVSTIQCFEIQAVNFTLDGAGHTLHGSGEKHPSSPGDHVGVKPRGPGAQNITIKNLRITHWGSGMYAPGWSDGLLDSCLIDSNQGYAYQVGDECVNNELKNSVFRDNALRAMKLSRVQNFYVHDNEIIHNGYNDWEPETTGGGIDVFTSLSLNNRIENNLFENNKDYALSIYGGDLGMPKHTLVKGNIFKNNGIVVEDSDSNTFIDNTFDGSASIIEVAGGIGNVFIDCEFEGWTILDLRLSAGAKVTFISTSFDGASVSIAGDATELSVGWHVDATVTVDDAPVEGAIVQFYDKDQLLVAEDTTDAEGKIDTLDLIEYVETTAGKSYVTPYSVVVSHDGTEIYSTSLDLTEDTHITTTTTATDDRAIPMVPDQFVLEQNHPNPFNPETVIHYQLPTSGQVTLIVYDLNGHVVRILADGFRPAGRHAVQWDTKNDAGVKVASGVYLYSFVAGEHRETRRMVLLR
ncbi:MAG: right-handed parallel beta-helix repeat-containing protein [Fidelibacterota bacterium]|nr:MAG: right-handed parallel beta-helix repeat-containing protein [Candidatus Neomarinimicrobiota bacterium]